MRGSQSIDDPMIVLTVSDERADAHDRVVDVLGEFLPDGYSDLFVGLADQPVRGDEAVDVGYGL
jgi:hypothetical protein